jgi:hypothetical protein
MYYCNVVSGLGGLFVSHKEIKYLQDFREVNGTLMTVE